MSIQRSRKRRGILWWLRGVGILLLVLVAATWLAGAGARRSLAERYPPPGQLVDVGGFRMHLHCSGTGEPAVILLAGLDDFSITWSRVQPQVAATTRVCSYDRAGLGWSEVSSDARTARNMVDELHRLLLAAPVEPPYIFAAHSFGGPLARLYIETYPGDVTGLLLVDAAPLDLFRRIPGWDAAIQQKVGFFRTLAPMSSFGLLALAPGSVPNRGFPEQALAQYRAIAADPRYWRTAIAENEMFALNLDEVSSADVASLGDLPLVVLSRGTWDPMPGFTEQEDQAAREEWDRMQLELVSLSSNATRIVARQSEHFIQLQQPEVVIDAIRSVIEAVGG